MRIKPFPEPDWFVARGLCHQSLGSHALALADFESAIKHSPSNKAAWFNKAMTHNLLEHWEDAHRAATKRIEQGPQGDSFVARAMFERGTAAAKLSWVVEAAENFQHACDGGYEPGCAARDATEQELRRNTKDEV